MPEALPDGITEVVLQGGIPLLADSGVVAAATATATLTPAAGKTAYLTSFTFTGGGATAGSLVTLTITGLLGGTKNFVIAVPAGATLGIPVLTRIWDYPIPASAPSTAIVISCPSLGAGNTAAAVTAAGFYT